MFATLASALSGGLAIAKTLATIHDKPSFVITGFEGSVVVLSASLIAVLIYRLFEAKKRLYPFHTQALDYVKTLIANRIG